MVRIFARGKNKNASRPSTVSINREGLETGMGVELGQRPPWIHRNLFEMKSVNSYMQGALKNLLGNKLKRHLRICGLPAGFEFL